MSFPTYINFQVHNSGGGRSNMVVHTNAVILMLLSLFPESFVIFIICIEVVKVSLNVSDLSHFFQFVKISWLGTIIPMMYLMLMMC